MSGPGATGSEHTGGSFFASLWQDIRFGTRVLRRSSDFTAVAILTLVLSIGATTAIFTVVDRILLLPWPGPHPEHLITLMQGTGDQPSPINSIPKFMMWSDQANLIEQPSVGGLPASASRVSPLVALRYE